jgi:dTDP-4-dehydrorhamnose reductase
LARLAQRHGIRLVHVSTDQVFDGESAPYRTTDSPAPLNAYGRLKAESEAFVRSLAPGAATVRAPLLMGNSLSGNRSLHERLLAEWAGGGTARLFVDEIRQVAHADNLAAVLIELAARWDVTGIFHWAGTDACSRHELGLLIRQRFGLNEREAPIEAVTRAQLAAAVRARPRDLRLDLEPLCTVLRIRPQSVMEQLGELLPPREAPGAEGHFKRS